MKVVLKYFIIILFIPVFLFAKGNYKDHKHIVIIPKDWKPYYMLDEKGKPAGFAVELFEKIAKEIELDYEYKVVNTWNDLFPLLKNGKAHIVPNVGISENRKSFLLFTTPTDTFVISLFKRVTSKDINSFEDLKDKKIGVVDKNVAQVKINKEHPEFDIKVYNDHFKGIHGLLSGEIDVLVFPKAMVISTLKELNIDDKITPFGENYMEVVRAVGISKQHADMYDALNQALEEFKKNSKYVELYEKWFGKEKTFEFTKEQIFMYASLFLTLILAILLLVFRNKSMITRKQLEDELTFRTKDLKETKDHLEVIFELNPNILFTTSGLKLVKPNKKFLDFVKYETKGAFLKEHECICDYFVKRKGYITKYMDDGTLWIDYILQNKDMFHKAVIIKNEKEYIFEVIVRELSKGLFLVLMHEISMLEQTRLSLKRSNEDLQQFAYIASHDLQEPLRMVSSYLQLIERRYRDKLDDDGIDFINFAVDGAKRMRDLINGLLEFSRVQSKGGEFKTVSLKEVLDEVLQNLLIIIEEKGATVNIKKELPDIVADKRQMIQLFQNLIGNSLKYCEKKPVIDIGAEEDGDFVTISLKDNGIGIDKEYFKKIFLIFQRLHGKDSKYEGTGIGLAVCKRIMQRHHGEIYVESKLGEGSTFYLKFNKKGFKNGK